MPQKTRLTDTIYDWSPAVLPSLSQQFEGRRPDELLRAALAAFGPDLVLATGFGPSGVVLMHMLAHLSPETPVFYLQTDLLFPETLAVRDELAARLGLKFIEIHCGLSLTEQAAAHGPDLWQRNPDLCCHLRKVSPLRQFLADKAAWVTGLRRDQSTARAQTPLLAWDMVNGLVKLNPLVAWSEADVWGYIAVHHLPYNVLHDQGYPSLGCIPCTRSVAEGQDVRAGRWAGWNKTECGIHLQPEVASRTTSS